LHKQVIGRRTPGAAMPPVNGVRSRPGNGSPAPGSALIHTPAASNVIALDLSRQMEGLKGMVRELSTQIQQQRAPQVPEELVEHYSLLTDCRVCPSIALEVIKSLQQMVRPEHLALPEFVREKLTEQIEKLLVVAGPIARTKSTGPHVVALIGPTGVGKTTTIAKLAANLKLREKHGVGLITSDTYRIAAIDQLKRFAEIIKAPLSVVSTQDDLGPAIDSMRHLEFILIDTAGRSPNDTLKIGELRNVVAAAGADEVHLVLSATSSEECLQRAIERFEEAHVDKLIFTKLDEADRRGALLNVLRKVGKPMSYVTTGQAVPDDIEVAHKRRLAQLILGSEL
jgi:flagellar biosynthesis protein FlhF